MAPADGPERCWAPKPSLYNGGLSACHKPLLCQAGGVGGGEGGGPTGWGGGEVLKAYIGDPIGFFHVW